MAPPPPSKQSSGDTEAGVAAAVAAAPPTAAYRQDFVFCDPVAFRYIEEEPHCTVLFRSRVLTGYEVYLVEQWACSRVHPTFVISTYTGDAAHEIAVSVLRITADEPHWSQKLQKYFELSRQYARPKQTALGTLMVTNLSSFPSALTVVPVPGGDVKRHRIDFIVNENLKRMGCSGRSALSLTAPPDACITKFHQLFRTSDRVPFQDAVRELVRLCQVSLVLFDKLQPRFVDGLLCDVSEKGLRDWWAEFGDLYKTEPNDGILGPTTVAALLGMTMSARNRLSTCGAPVPKDAFDLLVMEKAVHHFQRQQRFEKRDRTGKLDRYTLDLLHQATVKSSGGDIFAVPRAIKSTVVDLGARAVGSSYGPAAEANGAEKPDIERFIEHIHGESLKHLWMGKPRKSTGPTSYQAPTPARRNSAGGHSLSDNEILLSHGGSRDPSNSPAAPWNAAYHNVSYQTAGAAYSHSPESREGTPATDLRKAVFRSMTGRMKDVASGISAGADYVRYRGHQRSSTKDLTECPEADEYAVATTTATTANTTANGTAVQTRSATPAGMSLSLQTQDLRTVTAPTSPYIKPHGGTDSPGVSSIRDFAFDKPFSESPLPFDSSHPQLPPAIISTDVYIKTEPETPMPPPHIIVDSEEEADLACLTDPKAPPPPPSAAAPRILRRRHSHATLRNPERHSEYYPRRLSFSLAEPAILSWTLPFSPAPPIAALDDAELRLLPWTTAQLSRLAAADAAAAADACDLNRVGDDCARRVDAMEDAAAELVRRKTDDLREMVRKIETLGARLEYELGGLSDHVRDLEEAVGGLGKFVEEVEDRAQLIESHGGGGGVGWWGWLWGRKPEPEQELGLEDLVDAEEMDE